MASYSESFGLLQEVILTVRIKKNDYLRNVSKIYDYISDTNNAHPTRPQFNNRFAWGSFLGEYRWIPRIDYPEVEGNDEGVLGVRFQIFYGGESRSTVLVAYADEIVDVLEKDATWFAPEFWNRKGKWEDGQEPKVKDVHVNYEFDWNLAQGAATVTISTTVGVDDDEKQKQIDDKLGPHADRFRRKWGTSDPYNGEESYKNR